MPARAGRSEPVWGEAPCRPGSDEAGGPRRAPGATGPGVLDAALARENVQRAWTRVKANKGAAGVDGLDIAQTAALLRTAWPAIRDQVLSGTYRPQPVRFVAIPKPGGGERELGIPTVTDRLIQQALLQVLQPLLDPHFSEHSYGYRPGRGAQDAVLAAQTCVQAGRRVVVDVDLAKFFDRVNHDILIDRLQKRIGDAGVIRLVRAYLTSGIMKDGVVQERGSGTPQGGPLSPLLANVLLDEVDRDLERRGHHFVRYADDVTVYVRSRKAGARVMDVLRDLFGRLKLSLNEAKSAVRSAFGCVVLGFTFWVAPGGVVKRRVASSASLGRFKQRVRDLTRRSGGRSIPEVVDRLRIYLLGWKGYYRLAQTPKVWRELDGWVRHRVRALQLKQWKRGPTIYRRCGRSAPDPRSRDRWRPTAVAGGATAGWRSAAC